MSASGFRRYYVANPTEGGWATEWHITSDVDKVALCGAATVRRNGYENVVKDEVDADIYGKPVCTERGRLAVQEGLEKTPVPTGPRLTDRWNRLMAVFATKLEDALAWWRHCQSESSTAEAGSEDG